MTLTLGIDTSGRTTAVALASERKILFERSTIELGSAEALIELLEEAVRSVSATPNELTEIAVCVGPGSYTGIRTGLAAACGLRLARPVRVLGISSLLAGAYSAVAEHGQAIAYFRANKNEYFAAAYASSDSGEILVLREACALADGELEAWRAELTDAATVSLDDPHPTGVGAAGRIALAARLATSAEIQEMTASEPLEPLYIKPVRALTLAERGVVS